MPREDSHNSPTRGSCSSVGVVSNVSPTRRSNEFRAPTTNAQKKFVMPSAMQASTSVMPQSPLAGLGGADGVVTGGAVTVLVVGCGMHCGGSGCPGVPVRQGSGDAWPAVLLGCAVPVGLGGTTGFGWATATVAMPPSTTTRPTSSSHTSGRRATPRRRTWGAEAAERAEVTEVGTV
ncbi:hypothetical protein ACWEIJ_36110 [Lentzea sp. NPDC004789]